MKKTLSILLLLAAMGMSAQEVPTFFPRKFLLEHFTSENCNQCPMGMRYIAQYLEQQTTPYIWVSHHAVYGIDEYTLDESNEIAMNFMGIYSVPSVVINRTEQSGELKVEAWDLESWIAEGRKAEGDTIAEASVEIEHSYNAKKHELNVTVRGQVANMERKAYLLTILIKENGLVGEQADAFSSWKQVDWKEYMHPRVVRGFVNGTFGDTVKVENQAYSYSTNYTMDKDWVAENCCVVAYITPIEKMPVINAEQVPVVAGTEGGEQYDPYGITEGKGPNTSIEFDSVCVKKMDNDQLEIMLLSSKTIQSRYMGICKQVGYLYVHSDAEYVLPGTYPIRESDEMGTITTGYRVDEEETLGGSRLVYALSSDLKNGIVTPIHQWRMSSGEMKLDEDGNISLDFTTYNGTSVTATAQYDFTSITAVEEVKDITSSKTRKIVRNGQLLIEQGGEWHTILGCKL